MRGCGDAGPGCHAGRYSGQRDACEVGWLRVARKLYRIPGMSLARCAVSMVCVLVVVASCVGGGGAADQEPPSLAVIAPARAAMLDGQSVVVSGTASDVASGVASVSVNGVAAEVAPDGSFRAELPLDAGVSLIDVAARDGAGNEAHDVRAVLAGHRSQDRVVASGLVARIGPGGYGFLADAVRAGLAATDLGGAATGGALMSVPDCFEVNMGGLQHGAIDVNLEPRDGGVGVALAVHDVVLDLEVDMGGFCDTGDATAPARLTADTLWLRGVAGLDVSAGGLAPDLRGLSATFDGVTLDTSGLPAQVVSLLLSNAPSELAGALGDAIGPLAGDAIGEALGNLDALAWTPAVQGFGLTVRLAPTAATAGTDGLAVIASVELEGDALGPVGYVARGAAAKAPSLGGNSALRLGVSDDVANLALAALWAGGFLDRSVAIPDDSPARTLLGLDHLDSRAPAPADGHQPRRKRPHRHRRRRDHGLRSSGGRGDAAGRLGGGRPGAVQ